MNVKKRFKQQSRYMTRLGDRIAGLYARHTRTESYVATLQRQVGTLQNAVSLLQKEALRAQETPTDVFEAKIAGFGTFYVGDVVTVRRFPSGHAVVVRKP